MGLFDGLFKPDVEKLERKKDLEGLIDALKYQKDDRVCTKAARALCRIGDPRSIDPLIAALKDSHSLVRYEAAYVLGIMGDPRAVEPLITALNDPNNDVCINAALALDKLKWTPSNWIEMDIYSKCMAAHQEKYSLRQRIMEEENRRVGYFIG